MASEYSPLFDEENEEKPEDLTFNKGTAGVAPSIFNMVNTIIGGGMLALPFAFKLSGLILGVIAVVVVALLSAVSSYLLVKTSLQVNGTPQSYRDLAMLHFGRPGLLAVEICQILFLLGTTTGYMVIIGDIMGPFATVAFADYNSDSTVDSTDFWARPNGKILAQAVVIFLIPVPLSILKRINLLSWTSLLSIACIGFLVTAIAFRSIEGFADVAYAEKEGLELVRWSSEFFRSIPVISFAFTFQMQLYSIWSEMKEKQKIQRVVLVSVSICSTAYLIVGILGYLSFLSETSDNILKNYANDVVFDIAKGLLALIICFSYPLMSYPLLGALDNLIFPKAKTMSFKRRVPEALVLAVISFGLAIAVPDITVVFGYIGATSGNFLVYIMPAAFYLSGHRSETPWYKHRLHIVCYLLAGVGIGFMIASLYAITADLVNPLAPLEDSS